MIMEVRKAYDTVKISLRAKQVLFCSTNLYKAICFAWRALGQVACQNWQKNPCLVKHIVNLKLCLFIVIIDAKSH